MRTPFTLPKHSHVATGNSVLSGNVCAFSTGLQFDENIKNLFVADFLDRAVVCSVLINHVPDVIGRCTEPEMVGINTQRRITGVTYPKPIWNPSFVNHKRRSVSKVGFSTVLDLTVEAVVLACINPASIRINREPISKSESKRLNQRKCLISSSIVTTTSRAVFRFCDIRRRSRESELRRASKARKNCFSHA